MKNAKLKYAAAGIVAIGAFALVLTSVTAASFAVGFLPVLALMNFRKIFPSKTAKAGASK